VVVDVLAFLTFHVPVYAVTLLVAGASFTEIATAMSATMVFMVSLNRPLGIFLEALRKLARTARTVE
jgi:hypothetical protein